MDTRINISQLEPEAYKIMYAFEKYLSTTKLTPIHKELIKIRASQMNGCAFCINMHTKDARKYGETEQRIYALNAWRDTNFFSEEEKAILALTEEMTLISNHISDATYENARKALNDDNYLAQVMVAIITINSWNRIAISTKMMPEQD
ncbi:carboxymuconolactone decarboxylase family protein [Flavobacterium cerinum]|uniref:Carboxymuconolactone decarboxylase family protein n=1 Tax=Flavobacterium cerinum TaxID=2502784 RepID=A0ABY5ISB0_9FLAO|nr:carboxymuconolactone decarboxylase family protein [Flavobacterium cerinum]UUC45037.1 carboxymuconolactone decarboxylase family protein [Flavobacterium cerinum]